VTPPNLRRSIAPFSVAMMLGAGLAVAPLGGNTMPAFASCGLVYTSAMTHQPTTTSLPSGATLRVWRDSHQTVNQVYVPASSPLSLHVWTSGALTRTNHPTAVLGNHGNGVAIMNGSVFDPNRGSLIAGPQIVKGVLNKAEKTPHNAILIDKTGRKFGQGEVSVAGKVTAAGKSASITSLNWQSLSGGVGVYTAPWGSGYLPHGSVNVVVANGVVKAVRHSSLSKAPGRGQTILTGSGSTATFLNGLHVGAPVTVAYHPVYAFHYGETPFPVYEGTDHGMPYWLDGTKWEVPCTSSNDTHYSRSAFGVDKKGDFWLFVCSGPSRSKYGGGCTHSEMQYYLKQMGAFNADQLDGDTSSTIAVRHAIGGSVFRVDKTNSFYQRSVPNYLAIM
jgi:exopolysaccharide biosynthesis protein